MIRLPQVPFSYVEPDVVAPDTCKKDLFKDLSISGRTASQNLSEARRFISVLTFKNHHKAERVCVNINQCVLWFTHRHQNSKWKNDKEAEDDK